MASWMNTGIVQGSTNLPCVGSVASPTVSMSGVPSANPTLPTCVSYPYATSFPNHMFSPATFMSPSSPYGLLPTVPTPGTPVMIPYYGLSHPPQSYLHPAASAMILNPYFMNYTQRVPRTRVRRAGGTCISIPREIPRIFSIPVPKQLPLVGLVERTESDSTASELTQLTAAFSSDVAMKGVCSSAIGWGVSSGGSVSAEICAGTDTKGETTEHGSDFVSEPQNTTDPLGEQSKQLQEEESELDEESQQLLKLQAYLELPFRVTPVLTVIRWGVVCVDLGWHNRRYIFPLGYTVHRKYTDYLDLAEKCAYVCSIGEKRISSEPISVEVPSAAFSADSNTSSPRSRGLPVFRIQHPRDVNMQDLIESSSPSVAWKKLVDRINEKKVASEDQAASTKVAQNINGYEMFGLTNHMVQICLLSLPNASQTLCCRKAILRRLSERAKLSVLDLVAAEIQKKSDGADKSDSVEVEIGAAQTKSKHRCCAKRTHSEDQVNRGDNTNAGEEESELKLVEQSGEEAIEEGTPSKRRIRPSVKVLDQVVRDSSASSVMNTPESQQCTLLGRKMIFDERSQRMLAKIMEPVKVSTRGKYNRESNSEQLSELGVEPSKEKKVARELDEDEGEEQGFQYKPLSPLNKLDHTWEFRYLSYSASPHYGLGSAMIAMGTRPNNSFHRSATLPCTPATCSASALTSEFSVNASNDSGVTYVDETEDLYEVLLDIPNEISRFCDAPEGAQNASQDARLREIRGMWEFGFVCHVLQNVVFPYIQMPNLPTEDMEACLVQDYSEQTPYSLQLLHDLHRNLLLVVSSCDEPSRLTFDLLQPDRFSDYNQSLFEMVRSALAQVQHDHVSHDDHEPANLNDEGADSSEEDPMTYAVRTSDEPTDTPVKDAFPEVDSYFDLPVSAKVLILYYLCDDFLQYIHALKSDLLLQSSLEPAVIHQNGPVTLTSFGPQVGRLYAEIEMLGHSCWMTLEVDSATKIDVLLSEKASALNVETVRTEKLRNTLLKLQLAIKQFFSEPAVAEWQRATDGQRSAKAAREQKLARASAHLYRDHIVIPYHRILRSADKPSMPSPHSPCSGSSSSMVSSSMGLAAPAGREERALSRQQTKESIRQLYAEACAIRKSLMEHQSSRKSMEVDDSTE